MENLIDKDTIHKVLFSLWKRDDNVGKMCYNQALQDAQTTFDSLLEEPKTDWLQELQEKLDSLSKEDFEKVMAKYSGYGEEEPVNEDLDLGCGVIWKCEEPVSEDLEEASKEWLKPQLDKSYASYGEDKMMELTHFDGYAMLDAIEFGVKWKEQQLEKNRLARCDAQTGEED